MKKSFILENLDCASCAAKMENAVRKIDGVTAATINFITQRMTIEVKESASFDDIIKKAAAVIKKIEPDCMIRI